MRLIKSLVPKKTYRKKQNKLMKSPTKWRPENGSWEWIALNPCSISISLRLSSYRILSSCYMTDIGYFSEALAKHMKMSTSKYTIIDMPVSSLKSHKQDLFAR